MVGDLFRLSKEYLRQETMDPAKRLGRYAGAGSGAGVLFAIAAVFGAIASYAGLVWLLPEGDWWVILARGIVTVEFALLAVAVLYRINKR